MKAHARLPILFLITVLLFAGGCLLQSQGTLQTLVLLFQLTQDIPRGDAFAAHTATYPNDVQLKGQFVRISGKLDPVPDATEVTVEAIGRDPDSGKQLHKFRAKVRIRDDGSFEAVQRFKKNIAAGTVQTITIAPAGGPIAADTQVGICVDVTRRKGDFTAQNSCATSNAPPGGEDGVVVVSVQDNAFSPKSVTIQPGDTVRWELTGRDTSHNVTAMSGAFESGFVFTSTGAFFERTFPESEDGETFEYSCTTHQACCQMQGSILVGADASPPTDGY